MDIHVPDDVVPADVANGGQGQAGPLSQLHGLPLLPTEAGTVATWQARAPDDNVADAVVWARDLERDMLRGSPHVLLHVGVQRDEALGAKLRAMADTATCCLVRCSAAVLDTHWLPHTALATWRDTGWQAAPPALYSISSDGETGSWAVVNTGEEGDGPPTTTDTADLDVSGQGEEPQHAWAESGSGEAAAKVLQQVWDWVDTCNGGETRGLGAWPLLPVVGGGLVPPTWGSKVVAWDLEDLASAPT